MALLFISLPTSLGGTSIRQFSRRYLIIGSFSSVAYDHDYYLLQFYIVAGLFGENNFCFATLRSGKEAGQTNTLLIIVLLFLKMLTYYVSKITFVSWAISILYNVAKCFTFLKTLK